MIKKSFFESTFLFNTCFYSIEYIQIRMTIYINQLSTTIEKKNNTIIKQRYVQEKDFHSREIYSSFSKYRNDLICENNILLQIKLMIFSIVRLLNLNNYYH